MSLDALFTRIVNHSANEFAWWLRCPLCRQTQQVVAQEHLSGKVRHGQSPVAGGVPRSELACPLLFVVQVDPRRSQEAMKDPEIQAILKDPIINQVLHNLSTNPRDAQQ